MLVHSVVYSPRVTAMGAKFLLIFLVLVALSSVQCHSKKCQTFNVIRFGAKGDGRTDDTQAFENAWNATCWSTADHPTMVVPSGTFLLHPLVFHGPCKSNKVNVVIDGTLVAPSDPSEWKCHGNCGQWITFLHLDGLYISGYGTINGRGAVWWDCEHNKEGCSKKPTVGFTIGHSNDVHIKDLKFKDSPRMHIAIERSTWVHLSGITITAPGHSPNTDGIHIQQSQNVFASNSSIGTGDDCISIGDGSAYLNISSIDCGPGHGISIGSLGKHGAYETVEHVHVSDVDFRGTSNGARIKTWQGGRGFVRNIIFKHIRSFDSVNPIIIDQFYCDHTVCTNQTSAVHVSNIRYSQFLGTTREETAVKFACSESVPCSDILMEEVNLRTTKHNHHTRSLCLNTEGRQRGRVFPEVPCLN